MGEKLMLPILTVLIWAVTIFCIYSMRKVRRSNLWWYVPYSLIIAILATFKILL